jgi:hypothetical protein
MSRKPLLLILLLFGALSVGSGQLEAQAAPPASQCVQDVNGNGVGDVADIQATATQPACQVYLPLVAANWRRPWPTETPTPTPTSQEVPPLHFFYAIHTHVHGDWFPYTDPSMTQIDTTVADNMLAAIQGIAGMLDEHGAKGTWEVVFGTSKGLCNYQGENHVFQQLLDGGHEVAVHAHRNEDIAPAFHNLEDDCGITPQTTSGFMAEASQAGVEGAQAVVSQAMEQAVDLGMSVGTSNLSPAGNRNPFGPLCDNQLGVGNDMWPETGNLMFPWRPDYLHQNICADNPQAGLVLVDHVPITWMAGPGGGMPDVLSDAEFQRLKQQFDAALAYMEENRPQRVAAWGFVTHLTEYAAGNQGENPPDPAALAALDRFLDYVDSKVAEGRVVYATAEEIARLVSAGDEGGTPTPTPTATSTATPTPPSGHTYHDVDRLPNGHTLITDGGPRPSRREQEDKGMREQGEKGIREQGEKGIREKGNKDLVPPASFSTFPLFPFSTSTCSNCSRVVEVNQEGNVIWSFDQGLSWAHNADRLPDGHTLISDTGRDRVIEVDAEGNIVWNSRDVTLSDGSHLHYPNDANWLPDDHFLITDRDNHRVIEIDRDGTIVWQFGEAGVPGSDATHLNGPHNADRLPTGNTIIADSENKRVIEVTPDGTIVWEYPPAYQHTQQDGRRSLTEPMSPRSETFGDQWSRVSPRSETFGDQGGDQGGGADALNWPRDADRLPNGNTLITDSRNNRVIEVTRAGQIIWQYTDLNLPYDADRLANGHTLISGAPGGGVIEVGQDGTIVWQYPPQTTATGTIAGTVRDAGGQPIAGATVTVFGTSLADTTDADGGYTISDVPVAAPRYILTAEKSGYQTAQAGDIDVAPGATTTVDFTLQAGDPVTDTLHVMIGRLMRRDPASEKLVPPPDAVLDPALYPDEVLPYLEPGQYIESDDPAIVAVAQSILASLSPKERTQQTTVAHAVYAWMVQNIEYDLVHNYPGDVTSGNWQTTYGAWGHSFADWLYTAREVLEEGRAICIEHARLATALLRAVGIPARPAPLMAHPVTQWWVQLPDGSGFWANMDTSKGRSDYVRTGDLWAQFPSRAEHQLGFWAIGADAPIHMDWWTENPTLWTEDYGSSRRYPATADGLAQAQAALAYFAENGELPPPSGPPPAEDQPYYELSTRGFVIDLTNVGDQTHFDVGFPLAMETDYVEPIDQVYWTNHPEWVTQTWLETESDPDTGESLTWYRIALDSEPTTPSAAYEPPIEITFNIHFDPVLSDYDTWRERKDNLLWLESFVEGYSGEYQPKLNLEVQGDQAEFYLDPNDPGAAEGRAALAALYQAGHTFGTHAHNTIRDETPHSWHVVQGTPTAAQSVEHWQDHLGYVEQLYAAITGNDDPAFLQEMNASAMMFFPSGEEAQQQAFAGTYSDPVSGQTVPHGFSIQTGGPDEHFYCLFDHEVENPWRPGTQGPLDEDLSNTAFVRIPGLPPLGKIGVHGHIPDCYQDTSLPSYQRMFIQTFLERLYHEYTGAEDKTWTFGWHEHLFDLFPAGHTGQGRELREEVQGMVDWLNQRFIGHTTANGNPVAHYATMTEVRDDFLSWEADHPGASSFELTQYSADWENYPYDLQALARELANAHYDAALLPSDSTLQVYRFERCPSSLRGETQGYWAYEADGSLGCYDSASDRGEPAGNPLPTKTVYVAWRDAAEPEPTDLIPYVGRFATAYDGITGTLVGADDALNALPLNYRPVILLPGPAGPTPTPTPTPAGYLMIPYNANYLWGPPAHLGQAGEDQFVSTLNRHLDLMDELGVTAGYYFTGLAAEKLAEWSPQTVTRLLNSDHGINYHGANRPPYPQLVEQVKGKNWEEDVATVRTYEAQGVNPATGEHVGGIAGFRQTFGQDPFATGRFFEASILYVDKEMGARMAVGLKGNTGASRDDAWFLGVLNRPTQAGLSASGLAQAAIEDRADEYLAYARSVLTSVSGPMPLAVLPIHDHDFFAHTPANQEKVWDLYEQVLRLALDLGFQPVTMRDVYAMVQNGPAPTLTRDDLLAAAQSLVDTMEATGYPPDFVEGNAGTQRNSRELRGAPVSSPEFPEVPTSSRIDPLSLAEVSEGLARALAAYRETGSLPSSVETHDLLGPTAYFTGTVTVATVSADDVLDTAVAVSAAITDRIPSQVTVGGQTVNPAEFLYLMAQEYVAVVQSGPAPVALQPISTLPLSVTQNQEADPLTRLQFWTFKPAVFDG